MTHSLTHLKSKNKQKAFTIVELLIVVVVIAILATISVVSYNGITKQATIASIKSDLNNNAKMLELTLADESNYPISENVAISSAGLKTSAGNDIQYAYIAANNNFCMTITSTKAGIPPFRYDSVYRTIYEGACKGQSAVTTFPAITGIGSLLAGSGVAGDTSGSSAAARFSTPAGVAADYEGNVYVADKANNRIRKIDSSGNVTTFAGSGTAGTANGTGTSAQFNSPTDVAIGTLGNIYVADTGNNRIRKITPERVVSTYAGSGAVGTTNGALATARFSAPGSVAIDASATMYIADTANNRIRKIEKDGEVTTFAGSGVAGSANGTGTAAQFNAPSGVAIDKSGNVYVADKNSHRIRKITPAGVVTTIAGSGTAGFLNSTTGTSAQFNTPSAISVDANGNIYVADTSNNRIRKITAAGAVTTLSGAGTAGYVNGSATTSQYSGPTGIATSPTGIVYIGDSGNQRIRKIQ